MRPQGRGGEGCPCYIWRLMGGNCCAWCLTKCTDDTLELAHVFGDGAAESKCRKGAGGIGVRNTLTRDRGLHLMELGRVVLLCPNCHMRYDPPTEPLATKLRQRGCLLFEQNKWLGDKMMKDELARELNGCGRPLFEKLCKQATIPVSLEPVKMNPVEPSPTQANALAILSKAKGQQAPVCETPGCVTTDCLHIHGNEERHGQFYNRVVDLRGSGMFVFIRKPERLLQTTVLIWHEDGSVEEGYPDRQRGSLEDFRRQKLCYLRETGPSFSDCQSDHR